MLSAGCSASTHGVPHILHAYAYACPAVGGTEAGRPQARQHAGGWLLVTPRLPGISPFDCRCACFLSERSRDGTADHRRCPCSLGVVSPSLSTRRNALRGHGPGAPSIHRRRGRLLSTSRGLRDFYVSYLDQWPPDLGGLLLLADEPTSAQEASSWSSMKRCLASTSFVPYFATERAEHTKSAKADKHCSFSGKQHWKSTGWTSTSMALDRAQRSLRSWTTTRA